MKHNEKSDRQSWFRGRGVSHYVFQPTLSFKVCRQAREPYLDRCRGGNGILYEWCEMGEYLGIDAVLCSKLASSKEV